MAWRARQADLLQRRNGLLPRAASLQRARHIQLQHRVRVGSSARECVHARA